MPRLHSERHEDTATDGNAPREDAQKAVVAFFSQTGNTTEIAAHIAGRLRTDSFELKAAEPYTNEDLDYNDGTTRATADQDAPDT